MPAVPGAAEPHGPIATRLLGLLLAAMAVQMIAEGLRELLPGLAR